jgi:N-methylhydantoinase A
LIDIHTVGAGGGSLAYVDVGGALYVGPESAGADPGPACYHADYAGWRASVGDHFAPGMATVSDANLVLGRLDAAHFLGGAMRLNDATARCALEALAVTIGAASAEEAAWGVIRVVNANMERAIRRVSVERGHDPRRFTLVAFGGGGPLHACELAEQLQIPRVLIPAVPGVLSALGMLVASPAKDYSRTTIHPIVGGDDTFGTWLQDLYGPVENRALSEMAAEGHSRDALSWHYSLDCRYLGQSHELNVPYKPGLDAQAIVSAFQDVHERRYGYSRPEATVELVTLRLAVVAPVTLLEMPSQSAASTSTRTAGNAQIGEKAVWFGDDFVPTKLYERSRLDPGHRLTGPAVIFQYDTTTLLPPGWQAAVDPRDNLILTRSIASS